VIFGRTLKILMSTPLSTWIYFMKKIINHRCAQVLIEVVPKPKNKDVVSSKWIYKIKHAADGSIEKHKARFVARGFSQKEGIDYEETFAPIARYISIRTIIALAAKTKWKLHQMECENNFFKWCY
jgi:hypothetical protein